MKIKRIKNGIVYNNVRMYILNIYVPENIF